MALIVRERLTGARRRRRAAQRLVELWRDWIEEKAGGRARRAGRTSSTTRRPSPGVVREMLASLDMAEELGDDRAAERRAGGRRRRPAARRGARARRAARTIRQAEAADSRRTREALADDEQADETEASDADRRRCVRRRRCRRQRRPGEARRPDNSVRPTCRKQIDYKVFTTSLRRDGRRRGAVRRGGARRGCAPISTSSWPICRASSPASPTGCSGG